MTPRHILWKPLDELNIQNPYAMYRKLREIDPVHHSQTGEWILTRYQDIKAILKDPRFMVGNRLDWLKRGITYLDNKDLDFHSIADAMNSFLLFLNPPQHTRTRKFISTLWNDLQVEELVKENIDELVHNLPANRFDVVKDFAQPLPALTMTRILGIPKSDYSNLKKYSRDLIKALDLYISVKDLVTIHQACSDFIAYFKALLKKKSFSEEGLLSKIYKANALQPEPLSESEIISICIFLFSAGEETTSSLTGTGVLNLLHHNLNSGQRINNSWDTIIDELLRFDPPVQLLGRIAKEDVEIGGKLIEKGSTTTLCLGAANRDPEWFDNPDELNLTRQQNRHLAFGSGIHFCLGDWLGKLQGKLAIRTLLETYPKLKLESNSYEWNKNLAIRSLTSLSVSVI